MNSAIEVIKAVADIGGQLGIVGSDKIRMLLPADCSSELKDAIRRHKAVLLVLLARDWRMVRSDLVDGIVFWAADDSAREALISAGADSGVVYTRLELSRLSNAPDTTGIVCKAKELFSGRILT